MPPLCITASAEYNLSLYKSGKPVIAVMRRPAVFSAIYVTALKAASVSTVCLKRFPHEAEVITSCGNKIIFTPFVSAFCISAKTVFLFASISATVQKGEIDAVLKKPNSSIVNLFFKPLGILFPFLGTSKNISFQGFP